ncbi:MAG: hypothetical protein GW802_19215 [Armatimonadetes bacterium]|nr:hypothetical protein [Armatimonadota bacterium]
MNSELLRDLDQVLHFRPLEVARRLGISLPSAHVLCSRYVRRGLFLRVKKDFYMTARAGGGMASEDRLRVANLLQVPSYISFTTALAFHEVTTQVQRDYVENAAVKRSAQFDIQGTTVSYHKLQSERYFDFRRQEGLFVATKEKAFVDAVYLQSLGRYRLDLDALDLSRLDLARLPTIVAAFPDKTARLVSKLCGT